LITGITALESCPIVMHTSLAGDHLRVMIPKDTDTVDPISTLEHANVQVQSVQIGEPNFEDFFIQLVIETAG
jgi:hypothetical protein